MAIYAGASVAGSTVSGGAVDGTTVLQSPPGASSFDGFIHAVNGKHYVMLENGDAYVFNSFESARDFLGYVCADAGLPPERINTGHVMIAMESLMGWDKAYASRTYKDDTDIPPGLPPDTDRVVQIKGYESPNPRPDDGHSKILAQTNGLGYLVPPSGMSNFTPEFFQLDPSLTPEQSSVASGIIFAKVSLGVRALYDFNFGTDTEAPAAFPNPNSNITNLVKVIWGAGTVPNEGHVAALVSAGLLVHSDSGQAGGGAGTFHLTQQGDGFLRTQTESQQTRFIPQGNLGGPDAMPDSIAMPVYSTKWFQGEGTDTKLADDVDLTTVKGGIVRFADSLTPRLGHPTPYAGAGLPEIKEGEPVDSLMDAVFGTTTGRTVEQVQSLIAHGLVTYDGTNLTITPKGQALLDGLQQAPDPAATTTPATPPTIDLLAPAHQTFATMLQWFKNNPRYADVFDSGAGSKDGYISWDDIRAVAARKPGDLVLRSKGFSEDDIKIMIGLAKALLNTGVNDVNFRTVSFQWMEAGHGGFYLNWLDNGYLTRHNPNATLFSSDSLKDFATQK